MSSLDKEYNPGSSFTKTFEQVRTLEFENTSIYPLEEEQQYLKMNDKGNSRTVGITFCTIRLHQKLQQKHRSLVTRQ